MKTLMKLIPLLLLGVMAIFISTKSYTAQNVKNGPANETITLTGNSFQDETQMKRGEEIYKEKCIICHMADGKGLTGAFPPLAEADYLLADKVRAVEQVLNGSNEPIVVNGTKYTTPMPPQVDTKEDAIAIINYVLNNFGNEGGYVTMEEVKNVKIKSRE